MVGSFTKYIMHVLCSYKAVQLMCGR